VADADITPNGQPLDDEYDDDEIVTVEATGRTVAEAIQKALDELGLEEDEVEVEIISEGSRGVLGLGAGEARVRVTSLPYEDDDEYDDDEQDEDSDEVEDEVAPPGNRRYEPEAAGPPRRAAPVAPPALVREHRFDPEAQPVGDMARQVLVDLLERMEIPAQVSLDAAELDEGLPSIELSVSGELMGILIGRHGDTLSALQFLLGLLVSRQAERRVRITVDIEGYRERRARLLRDMALRAAERVTRYRQPIFLDPMIPSERRIVHMALQDHPAVATHSIGEGDSRRVVVSPKSR
jgi:spoIIIJ-associated protein